MPNIVTSLTHLLLMRLDSEWWPSLWGTEMLSQTGSQENGERAFQGRRILRKSSNLAAGWWREEHLVFLTLWSRIVSSLQGRTSGTSHVLWPAVSRMLPKSSELWDWAFSCVPGAAHCISPWMDFYCYIFLSLSPLGIYISYQFVFQFQPLFGYMEML